MRKFALIIVSILVVFILALLALPYFVKVDQFRPQIVELVEGQLNAQVELGELKLSAFPTLKVSADSLSVRPTGDFSEQPIVETQNVELHVPIIALLTAPELELRVLDAKLRVLSRGKKSNIESIVKQAPPTDGEGESPAATTQKAPEESPENSTLHGALKDLPPWLRKRVVNARFHASLLNATILKKDLDKDSTMELEGLDLRLKEIGLGRPMIVEIAANLELAEEGLRVVGAFKSKTEMLLQASDAGTKIQIDSNNDFSEMEIVLPGQFQKAKGVPLALDFQGEGLQDESLNFDLDRFNFVFGKMILAASAQLKDLQNPETMTFQIEFDGKGLNLGELKNYVPMVADYSLGGSAEVQGSVVGTTQDPNFDLKIGFSDVTGSTPELKHPISQLRGSLNVGGKLSFPVVLLKIEQLLLASSDLSMDLKVEGIEKPQVALNLNSKLLNVDELLGLEPLSEAKGGAAKGASKTSAEEEVNKAPLDETLNELAPVVDEALENPWLDKASARFEMKIQELKAIGAVYKNASLVFNYGNRQLVLDRTGIEGYNGRFSLQMGLSLIPKKFSYNLQTDLNGVDIAKAILIHAPSWKDQIAGKVYGDFSVSGEGLRKADLEKNLRGSLSGEIKDGRTALPMLKLVASVKDSLPKIVRDKAGPELDKKAKGQTFRGEFKTLKLLSKIKGRTVFLENMDILFDGTRSGVGELRFKAQGQVGFDQQVQMLGVAFLDKQVKVPELYGKSGQVEIPMKLSGALYDPKMDYAYTTKILAERAGKALLNKHTAAARKKFEEEKRKAKARLDAEKKKAQAQAKAKLAAEQKKAKKKIQNKAEEEGKKLLKKIGL